MLWGQHAVQTPPPRGRFAATVRGPRQAGTGAQRNNNQQSPPPPVRNMIPQMHTPSALKSVLESANSRMDSGCASGRTWSPARATAPSLGQPTPGVVKQDKSSGGSVDTTKTRSDPQRVGMRSGERPIGAAKGKQTNTMALCQPPPPAARDALEEKGPQRRSQQRLDRRLEEVAKAVGGGYCRLQMLGGPWLGIGWAPWRGRAGNLPPLPTHPCPPPPAPPAEDPTMGAVGLPCSALSQSPPPPPGHQPVPRCCTASYNFVLFCSVLKIT